MADSLYDSGALGAIEDVRFNVLSAAALSFTTTVLLGALYLRVRRLAESTLPLVWSYTLAVSATGLVVWVTTAVVFLPAGGPDWITLVQWSFWVPAALAVVRIPLLLWYARRASRFSLAHAYFLVFVAGGISLPYSLITEIPIYAKPILELASGLLAVWLLGNFDLRGVAFRRAAAIALVALNGLIYLVLSLGTTLTALLVLLSFLLPLLLIYLVRVRHPGLMPAASPR